MANEVKKMVEEFIINSSDSEISIEDILDNYPEFDPERNRVDILMALKILETEKLGALAVGRRGKKTRFIKGAIRVRSAIDDNKLNALKSIINNMTDQQELILGENGLLLNDWVVYSDPKRTRIIDCLKTFEEDGIGIFVIGRRGGKSRFIKGGNRASKNKTFIIEDEAPKPIENSNKYNLVNNVIFQHKNGEFDELPNVLAYAGCTIEFIDNNLDQIQDNLDKFGYYSLAD